MNTDLESLAYRVLEGEKRAVAAAIRKIEDEAPDALPLLERLYPHIGNAHRIGITGPPGAGKSTFTAQLVKLYRIQGKTVGVIAADPTSPFSGGAIFGDRLRMNAVSEDPGVFIRSMGTRGNPGGLARQTAEAADILDASGKAVIIFETVGVGQIELDIAGAADTVVVITVPGAGDIIQAMKAGLTEIGDIFVVNKADLPGADIMKADMELTLSWRSAAQVPRPVVCLTDSKTGKGIEAVFHEIRDHFQYLKKEGLLQEKRNQRTEKRVRFLVNEHIIGQFWTAERLKQLKDCIIPHTSPHAIAERLVIKTSDKN
jgi:LAO/AO transport system kinase